VNLGLKTLAVPDLEVEVGDELDVLPDRVINRKIGKGYPVLPLPPARQAIVDAGGLITYTRKRLLENAER